MLNLKVAAQVENNISVKREQKNIKFEIQWIITTYFFILIQRLTFISEHQESIIITCNIKTTTSREINTFISKVNNG